MAAIQIAQLSPRQSCEFPPLIDHVFASCSPFSVRGMREVRERQRVPSSHVPTTSFPHLRDTSENFVTHRLALLHLRRAVAHETSPPL